MSEPVQDPNLPLPDYEKGIDYWNSQSADLDGVLGGYGSGSLPRVDALGSRQFLQYMVPTLCTVPSAVRPLDAPPSSQRTRALDVGAGIGRVTQTVLLHLFSDVVLLEPVEKFVHQAYETCKRSLVDPEKQPYAKKWKGISDQSKSVTFLRGSLQRFDPAHSMQTSTLIGRLGYAADREETGFDAIWCQWCLGHLSDDELVAFFSRAKASLRPSPNSLIVVKENLCRDQSDGGSRTVFDDQDSSVTRSNAAWLEVFRLAKLNVVRQQKQEGLPPEIYVVKMYDFHGSSYTARFGLTLRSGMHCDLSDYHTLPSAHESVVLHC